MVEVVGAVGQGVVYATSSLKILGVERFGTGVGIAQLEKKNKDTGEIFELELYEQQRNMRLAIKQAHSDTLPRAALAFNVGWYLRDQAKNAPLNAILDEATHQWQQNYVAQHWARNGKGQEFVALYKQLGIQPEAVKSKLEPDRRINNLSDISLSFEAACERLDEIALEMAKSDIG